MITIEDLAVSEGVARFITAARQSGLNPVLTVGKLGAEAITRVYARPNGWSRKQVTSYMTYFLVFHRTGGEVIDEDILTDIIGTRHKDRAMKRGRLQVAGEMSPGCMGPFLSEKYRGDLAIFVDRRSYVIKDSLSFSTGVPVEKNGGYFRMPMQQVCDVLEKFHPGKLSLRELVK